MESGRQPPRLIWLRHWPLLRKKVLVVDADPQANASSGLGVDIRNVELSIYECLVNGEDASGAITQTEVGRTGYHPPLI